MQIQTNYFPLSLVYPHVGCAGINTKTNQHVLNMDKYVVDQAKPRPQESRSSWTELRLQFHSVFFQSQEENSPSNQYNTNKRSFFPSYRNREEVLHKWKSPVHPQGFVVSWEKTSEREPTAQCKWQVPPVRNQRSHSLLHLQPCYCF